VAEIIEERDITAADQDGWTISYRVRRVDGTEVAVLASCSGSAEASEKSDETDAFVADRGRSAALDYAQRDEPAAMIHLSVDSLSGTVRADIDR
jgi:hypothetical protein